MLNLSRAKRLGNEGHAAQLRRQFCGEPEIKTKGTRLRSRICAISNVFAVYHIDIQKSKVEGFMKIFKELKVSTRDGKDWLVLSHKTN